MNTFTDTLAILTAFFDTLPWRVLMVDERGRVTFVNQAMRSAGIAPDPATGTPLDGLCPEYRAALQGKPPWLAAQSGAVTRNEHGVTVTERIALYPLPFGACLFAVAQAQPASGLGEAQLARLASLGFMVAGVCHELANPLTAINSTVQLLRANPASPPALFDKGLANIAGNVQRMLNITRKLNDFSRAGDDARASINLRATVNDAVALVRHDTLMHEIDVVCTLDAATVVHGDAGQLQQVFCNVLTNAAQAMGGSGALHICDTHAAAGFVEIAIRDTGPGIAERDLPRLFEPFFTTKPAGHGTGLGLAISNEIVLAHGGSMRAANHAGGGACFYIRLPAGPA
jgi:two-component system NtrC family sensor kinase